MNDALALAAIIQGSDTWKAAVCGSVGSSRVPDIVRRVKSGGESATRKNTLAKIVLERITGKFTETYVSPAMQTGKDREAEGKAKWGLLTNLAVINVGVIRHPTIVGAHASPDGLIGEDGLYEGKAPEPAQHLEALRTGYIDPDYITQMQWQLACSPERKWCQFVSYGGPEFPDSMQIWDKCILRDSVRIAELEAAVKKFVSEVDEAVAQLRREFAL